MCFVIVEITNLLLNENKRIFNRRCDLCVALSPFYLHGRKPLKINMRRTIFSFTYDEVRD